jgi:hypothetical protein
MKRNQGRVQRQGRVYRFSIDGREYAAFIWQVGKQFHGRIDGSPQVPHCIGQSALAVRDNLHHWLVAEDAPK